MTRSRITTGWGATAFADFDKEKGLIEALGVSDRSTFVAFKGMTEVGRSVADMNKESIASLLRRTLE